MAWGWWFRAKSTTSKTKHLPISVIVAAHNEHKNLKALLPHLLNQQYSSYELIIVLDRCSDNSKDLLKNWQKKYPHLKMLEIEQTPKGWASKKWAITQGIALARYPHLAFTDADCHVKPHWLQHINNTFSKDTSVILGIGLYQRQAGLLNLLIRFETFYTAFQYIGMAAQGFPYMGVGRNLAYTKDFFYSHEGLTAFKGRLSGDDDLLVNAYAKAKKTKVMIAAGSHTFSEPEQSWRRWFRQKFRHLSASPAYSIHSKALLGIFHLAHLCFYAGLLVSLGFGLTNSLFFSLYMSRVIISWLLFVSVNQTIREKKLLYAYPVLDLLYFIYNLIVVPIGLTKKPEWKK